MVSVSEQGIAYAALCYFGDVLTTPVQNVDSLEIITLDVYNKF